MSKKTCQRSKVLSLFYHQTKNFSNITSNQKNQNLENFEHRIVGGSIATEHSWPWTILLTVCIDYGWANECFKCGGVLINREFVWGLSEFILPYFFLEKKIKNAKN